MKWVTRQLCSYKNFTAQKAVFAKHQFLRTTFRIYALLQATCQKKEAVIGKLKAKAVHLNDQSNEVIMIKTKLMENNVFKQA
jgi:hypothetical protein